MKLTITHKQYCHFYPETILNLNPILFALFQVFYLLRYRIIHIPKNHHTLYYKEICGNVEVCNTRKGKITLHHHILIFGNITTVNKINQSVNYIPFSGQYLFTNSQNKSEAIEKYIFHPINPPPLKKVPSLYLYTNDFTDKRHPLGSNLSLSIVLKHFQDVYTIFR